MAAGLKIAVLNAQKMDYDDNLDFGILSDSVKIYSETDASTLIERAEGMEAIVTKEMPVNAAQIAALPDSIKLICEAGTGYNNIDIKAARDRGITVCNIPAYSSERVAHTAIMLMLNLSSTMQVQLRMLERGDKSNFTEHLKVPHTELNGKTLGLVGAGNIGRKVVAIARAMDMNVLIYKRNPGQDSEGIKYVSLNEVLSQSDYISLHCPLTDATRHIINSDSLKLVKPSAFIVNTSRGALIDESALISALKEGRLAGAGLDVQETEPPALDNPLYTMENVIITPHMGWKGLETRRRLLSILDGNVKAYMAGKPINVVN